MELFEDLERLKLKFISAYRALCDAGRISESEFEEVLELVDELDETSMQELTTRLSKLGLLKSDSMRMTPPALDKFIDSWQTNQKK